MDQFPHGFFMAQGFFMAHGSLALAPFLMVCSVTYAARAVSFWEFQARGFAFIGFIMQKLIIWSRVTMSPVIFMCLGKGFAFRSAPFGWHDAHDEPEVPSFVSFQRSSPLSTTFL